MLFDIGDRVRIKGGALGIGGAWMPAGTACVIYNVLRTTRRKWFVVKSASPRATAVVLATSMEYNRAALAAKPLAA